MSKTLYDKKVNRNIKKLNKQLREDVFKTRFEVRQIQKATYDGIQYYLYSLIDNEQPERNTICKWYNYWEICRSNKVWLEMNDFIVFSNFWELYWQDKKNSEV